MDGLLTQFCCRIFSIFDGSRNRFFGHTADYNEELLVSVTLRLN